MPSSFRRLRVYTLAAALAAEVAREVARWPPVHRYSVGTQLIRALDSIGANIAEAAGRWHDDDKRRLLRIARGSLYEAEHWLLSAELRGLDVPDPARLDDIARMLNGLIERPNPR